MKLVANILELLRIPPVFFDGFLCCTLAMVVELENVLSKDDSYKYIDASWLFYVKLLASIYGAGASSLIFFRSKSYSDHLKTLPPSSNLQQQIKTNETEKPNPVSPSSLIN